MTLFLFWASFCIVVYVFVLFPIMLLLRGFLMRRPYVTADNTPSISIVVAAYNEAGIIREKLDNILSLDYPRDLLEIIIASDGSTDQTNAIVSSYAKHGIKLLALPRIGKNSALTKGCQVATAEILVFSDANSMFSTDALRALMRPFADPSVGGVAGNQVYQFKEERASRSVGERIYWAYDRLLKQSQDRAGSITSATGSIYAIRRSLFTFLPPGMVDDFTISTGVILQGYRLAFAVDAVAKEQVAESNRVEFGRKVRIIMGGLNSVMHHAELLNPFRYGFYAVQLFSHKLLRRLIVFPLGILLATSPFLWSDGFFYQLATIGQFGFYGMAAIGFIFEGRRVGGGKLFSIPFYFCMVYIAALCAVIRIIQGRRIITWETAVRESGDERSMEIQA